MMLVMAEHIAVRRTRRLLNMCMREGTTQEEGRTVLLVHV